MSHHLIFTRKTGVQAEKQQFLDSSGKYGLALKRNSFTSSVCSCLSCFSQHCDKVTYKRDSRNTLSLLTVSEDLSPLKWGRCSRVQENRHRGLFSQLDRSRNNETMNQG